MPPRNERVAAMVRSELGRDASITNDVLLKKAKAIDPKVGRLSPRQFHATYRLPVVRGSGKTAAASKPAPPAPPAPSATSAPSAAPAKRAAAAPAASVESKAPAAASTPSPAPTPTPSPAPAPAAPAAPAAHTTHAAHHVSTSTAVARPNAAEREAVRQILHLVAREALATEDRGSFVRLLDSLDERASVILGIFGRK